MHVHKGLPVNYNAEIPMWPRNLITYRVDDPGNTGVVVNARINRPHVYELFDFCVHLVNLKSEVVSCSRYYTLPVVI